MKTIFITLLTLLCVQCTRHPQLSTEQKLEDFDYLFQTLKENFPYFGVAKRQRGIDWLSNRDEYRERIKNTANDTEFFISITSILRELLQAGHLYVLPDIKEELDRYKRAVLRIPEFEKWIEVLEKSVDQAAHWNNIWWNHIESLGFAREELELQKEMQTPNFSGSSLVENKIAVMRVNCFVYNNSANDSTYISSFLEQIQGYEYMIIDIQNNMGGSSHYWRNHIVGRMIDTPIHFPRHIVIRDGAKNRHFSPALFERCSIATKENAVFSNLPCEILDGSFYLCSFTDIIMPNNPIPFKGKIFLLVNERSFSAADDFAHFCKASGWATVVGERTGGFGGSTEPTLFRLPNSGIIIKHPGTAGLNIDGSFMYETKTVPDIEIIAENSEQRLEKLIEYIKNRL